MNKKILLFLLMLMPLVASAQTKRTIHVEVAGTLPDLISNDEKYQIEELTLSGELNGTDFAFIRKMAGIYGSEGSGGVDYHITDGKLISLDLSRANIVKGGGSYEIVQGFGCIECSDDLFITEDNCIPYMLFLGTNLKNIVLPNSVTSIASGAFSCPLTSITISKSITNIGNGAFSGCNSLSSIIVENENSKYDSRNNCNAIIESSSNKLISGCKNTVIPNDCNSIGSSAFYECSSLTSITIPNNVISIGDNAFYGCRGLTSINIPNNVNSIGKSAFSYCSRLKTIVSEIENPFAIDDNVFYDYNYYDNSKDIYATATLIVPPGKKTAYQNTAGWNKFQNIVEVGGVGYVFKVDNVNYKIGENNTASVTRTKDFSGDVVIQKQVTYNGVVYTVTSIEEYAFYKENGIADFSMTSITIPSTITSIGFEACPDLLGLKAVYITDLEAWCKINFGGDNSNPLLYAQHLFLNGTEIKDLVIPNNITSIYPSTFWGCKGLSSLTIPNKVTSIGYMAFRNCSGLTSIVSEIENPFALSDDIFKCNDQDIYTTATLIIPPGKMSVYQNTAGWKKFTNIVEAELVGYIFEANGIRYKIGENNMVSVVSRDAKYSGNIVIPNQVSYNGSNYDVTSIGSSAFEGCVDMTSVSIPSSVTVIGDAAFYYCTGLTTVDIPNGVTTIGEGAFSKCGDLASVTIPGSVTGIESNAFFQCYALTQITSWIENPFVINSNVFPTSVYSNAALNVPSGKKTVYQNTSGWKKFENMSESSKCAKPIISYSNGKISFSCETEGVEFHYTISNTNSSTGVGSSVNFSPTVNISVYASKSGFANSDTSTTEIVVPAGLRGDLTGDGQVNVADHVELSKIILGQ